MLQRCEDEHTVGYEDRQIYTSNYYTAKMSRVRRTIELRAKAARVMTLIHANYCVFHYFDRLLNHSRKDVPGKNYEEALTKSAECLFSVARQ